VDSDEPVVGNFEVKKLEDRVRELERMLGRRASRYLGGTLLLTKRSILWSDRTRMWILAILIRSPFHESTEFRSDILFERSDRKSNLKHL
jgi:hypothetical protein